MKGWVGQLIRIKNVCGHRHKRKTWAALLGCLVLIAVMGFPAGCRARESAAGPKECVVLLHGLCRTPASMAMVAHHLERAGYGVINIGYASTRKAIGAVAEEELAAVVSQCRRQGYSRIHFVTHSMGAMVVRTFLQGRDLPEGSRVVMLAPPNQGSELVDWAHQNFPGLIRLAGPNVRQLGTQDHAELHQLQPIAPEVGIIIGDRSWNPYLSAMLPGRDDGKVTVERAKLNEMCDFWVAPCNHTTILLNQQVRHQIVHFLQKGAFHRSLAPKQPLQTQYTQLNGFLSSSNSD